MQNLLKNINIRTLNPVGAAAVVYDDTQTGPLATRGGAAAPTPRLYNMGVAAGVTFDVNGFALNDIAYFSIQTSHAMKLSSTLDMHIHYILPNTTTIGNKFKFQLDVVAAVHNGVAAVPVGSPFSAEATVAAADDTSHRTLSLGTIPGINTTASTFYWCKLTRIAASAGEYASEVYITSIDGHYAMDTIGSLSVASKV